MFPITFVLVHVQSSLFQTSSVELWGTSASEAYQKVWNQKHVSPVVQSSVYTFPER